MLQQSDILHTGTEYYHASLLCAFSDFLLWLQHDHIGHKDIEYRHACAPCDVWELMG